MTYLDLINAVLDRLREERITTEVVGTNPYYRSIGAHVNDAKRQVENSWQWGSLRGTDPLPMTPGVGAQYELPESADNSYVIKRILVSPSDDLNKVYPVRQVSVDRIRQLYADGAAAPEGQPREVAVTGVSESNGNVLVTVFPRPEATTGGTAKWTLQIDRVRHQRTLTDPEERLLVPSLPVYSLATALASRERGEVGGTPTGELFAVAQTHLSDAIAYDSNMYANEMDWFSESQRWHNTNVRTA